MTVTEYERNQLFGWFEERMGKERATTMMSLLPPVGWGDVATKRDFDTAVERLDTRFERLDTKIDTVAERLDSKIDTVAERLDSKIDTVAERLDSKIDAWRIATKADLHELRSDLQRTFVTWILTAQATAVAAVGLMLVALR